jgi:hypothetical protein
MLQSSRLTSFSLFLSMSGVETTKHGIATRKLSLERKTKSN